MNRPFLLRVAQDLHTAFNGRFDELTVVLPNKRTHLFLDEHIATLGDRPIWSPHYATIRDVFAELSPFAVADPVICVCLLHPIFQQALQQEGGKYSEDLDHFFSWGQVLLNDFEDIDNNLVDVQALCANIDDLERLSSNKFLNDRQEAAIRQFFSAFSRDDRTRLQQQFGTLWSKLPAIHEQFQRALEERHLAYEGMLKRRVVERLRTMEGVPQAWQHRQFAIVGFNVLSESERQLFLRLKQLPQTRFYWDDDPSDTAHEAVYQHVRANIKLFGQSLPPSAEASPAPAITLISAPTDNVQCRYAGEWLKQAPSGRSAIVLCDESLLLPVLHALPPTNGLNVTMGFPMQQTPIATFLSAVLAVQACARPGNGRLPQQPLVTLLQHPYTALLPGARVPEWLNAIREQRMHFLPITLFKECPLLQQVITPQEDTAQLLGHIDDAIRQLAQPQGDTADSTDALHSEALFNAHRLINQLRTVQRNLQQPIPANTLTRLLQQLLRCTTIPFHGEPITDVQLLGLLETRNLQFEHIAILSANEGKLPKDNFASSFIPYNLRQAYGLSTREQATDLYAYYFHRLIQGADTVDILFSTATDGTGKGERSRFLTQMLASGQPLTRLTLHSTLRTGNTLPLPPAGMAKTEAVMQALRHRYDTTLPHPHYLSPTALNTFLACPLRFAFRYIAQLREPDDPLDEEVEASDFGSIFHRVLETLYKKAGIGKELQAYDLLHMARNQTLIEEVIDRAFHAVYFHDEAAEKGISYRQRTYNGAQRLSREVLVRYVKRQLEADATRCPITIEAVEDDSNHIDIPVPGQDYNIRLGGIIDRIDTITLTDIDKRQQQLHRIVDYKTSAKIHKVGNLDDMFHPNSTSNHVFQTCYYADIYTTLHPDHPLAPALTYVKFAGTKDDRPCISLGKEAVTDFALDVKDEFHQRLLVTIHALFDPTRPFSPNPSEDLCKYCPFTALCPQ